VARLYKVLFRVFFYFAKINDSQYNTGIIPEFSTNNSGMMLVFFPPKRIIPLNDSGMIPELYNLAGHGIPELYNLAGHGLFIILLLHL
jgi:hypothetical protein